MAMTLEAFAEMYDARIKSRIMEAALATPLPYTLYTTLAPEKDRQIMKAAYSTFGTMGQWPDGEDLPLDEAVHRFTRTITMLFYGQGFESSRKMIDYGDTALIGDWADSLGASANQALGAAGAALLNGGFATLTTGDAVYLFSASHPTAGSTQSNLVGAAALSPTTWEAMILSGINRLDFRGKKASENINKLIVPPALRKVALEISGSALAPYTSDNQANVHQGVQVVIDPHLTSTTAFFGEAPNHKLRSYVGKPLTPRSYTVNERGSLVSGVEADFVFDAEDWYGVMGCAGA